MMKTIDGGLLVAFEGCEGSGKTTQASAAAMWLQEQGWLTCLTREPGGSGVGQDIRAILLNPVSRVDARAEALLFAADRAQHMSVVVQPAMNDGAIVVCDRYMDSSIAYQGIGRGLGVKRVRDLSMWASGGLVPHLTVLLDIPPEEGAARRGRIRPDRIEQEDALFHERVRHAFLDLARQDEERYLTIDARLSPGDIGTLVRNRIMDDVKRAGEEHIVR
jgi:dTMP kinase